MKKNNENLKMLCVRLNEDLHYKIKQKALDNRMSIQDYIISLLTKALGK